MRQPTYTPLAPAVAGSPEVKALRRRLAVLLAGIQDLEHEWDATIELVLYLRRRRDAAGQPTNTAAVLLDLQAVLRASAPLPERNPAAASLAELQVQICAAEAGYDALITRHVAHAADVLDQR